MNIKTFFAIILLLVPTISVAGDSTRLVNYWEVTFFSGAPISNSAVKGLALHDRIVHGFQIGVGHQFGASDYGYSRRKLRYPSIGLNLTYIDATHINQNKELEDGTMLPNYDYGRLLGLSFTIDNCYAEWGGGRWRFRSHIESGFAYAFNPSTPDNNKLLGGHLQALFSYGCFVSRVWGKNEFVFGPQFIHASNSNITYPNCGLNGLVMSLKYRRNSYTTLQHSAKTLSLEDQDAMYELNEHRWIFTLMNSIGWRSYGHPYDRAYMQYNASVNMLYRYRPHVALGLGLDMFHGPKPDSMGKRNWLGLALVRENYIPSPVGKGMFAISMHVGLYLNGMHEANWTGRSRLYERIGLKYFQRDPRSKVSPFMGFYIKGNQLEAEQLEVCYGVTLPR